MKFLPTIALGVALSLGGAAIVQAPAFAQKSKKEKPAPAKQWQLSKEFRAAIAPAEVALKANDYAAAETAIAAGEAIAKPGDEQYIASQYRLQLGGALKNPEMQYKAIVAALGSGSVPAEDATKYNFFAGQLAYNAQKYADAVKYLGAIDQQKFATVAPAISQQPENALLLLAESNFKLNQIPAGLNYIQQAIDLSAARGTKAPQDWYARAASFAYKANLPAETAKWTLAQLKAYPSPENWRSALYIFRDANEKGKGAMETQINLDLLRLMQASKSLASERDYYEYASAAQERGLPGEAKMIIEEGRALNKLPKTNQTINELYTLANSRIAADKASLPGAETKAASAPNGRLAASTADAYFGYGEYAKAAALYRTALQKGDVDADQVNTRLGIALARSGDAAGARDAFSKVAGSPRAGLAQFWMLWLEQQSAPATASAG